MESTHKFNIETSWTKRKAITINGSPDGILINYQLKITVPYDPGMRENFGDIIFTSSDGVTLINYWMETETNTTSANFYVKVPEILASPSTTTIYMYYGSGQTLVSNGNDTFSFFQDFEEGNILSPAPIGNSTTHQTIPTYVPSSVDNTGQNVHPDVVYISAGWHGYKYWMAMTPYPNGNDTYENPSIVASNDGSSWVVPSGLTNPLIQTPSCGHNDDPSLIYDSNSNQLWLYFLETRVAGACNDNTQLFYNHNYLKLITSGDGIHWSSPITAINWDLSTSPLFISPSVVLKDGIYRLWMATSVYPNSNSDLTLWQSNDGINWGTPQLTNNTSIIWHLNVKYIPEKSEYWMISSDYSRSGNLQFAKSPDGVNWTAFPSPILYPGGWNDGLYRATFLYDSVSDLLKIWYSARNDQIWYTSYVQKNYTDFYNFFYGPSSNIIKDWTKIQGDGTWTVSTEQKKRDRYSGKFSESTSGNMIVETPEPLANNFFQEWNMYDNLDSTALKMVNTTNDTNSLGVGVNTTQVANHYVYSDGSSFYTTSIPRTLGWHKFGILFKSNSSAIFYIDDQEVGSLGSLPFNTLTKISVSGNTTFYVDDIIVRSYTPNNPTYLFNNEEVLKLYDTNNPSITPINAQPFTSLSGFQENTSVNEGEIRYQISNDSGASWYWYNNGWVLTTGEYEETSTADEINSNIGSFPKGREKFLFKAYFHSNGIQLAELDSIDLTYENDTTPPGTPTATPTAGTYNATQTVTLDSVGNGYLQYSLTETPADCSSGILYTDPIIVSTSETIYVRACDNAGNSLTASFAYVISLPLSEPEVVYHSGGGGHVIRPIINLAAPTISTVLPSPSSERILKLKMTGEDVKALQIYLNTHGYILAKTGFGSPGHETNFFGILTKKVVIKFQLANGLKPDGIVGPKTREKMNK